MGSNPSKEPKSVYFGLTVDEQIQILEEWNKIGIEIPLHAKEITRRFFEAYPDYQKYFAAVTNCIPEKVCNHSRVVTHGESILEFIDGFVVGRATQRAINQKIAYVALVHKDLGLTFHDFENYIKVFIRYIQTELSTHTNSQKYWKMLLGAIIELIDAKIEEIRKIEAEQDTRGNDIIFTPEKLKLKPRCNHFSVCKGEGDPWLESFGLLIDTNFSTEDFWIARKDFWVQQLYAFDKQMDFAVELADLKEYSEKDSNSKQSESMDLTNRHVYLTSEDFTSLVDSDTSPSTERGRVPSGMPHIDSARKFMAVLDSQSKVSSPVSSKLSPSVIHFLTDAKSLKSKPVFSSDSFTRHLPNPHLIPMKLPEPSESKDTGLNLYFGDQSVPRKSEFELGATGTSKYVYEPWTEPEYLVISRSENMARNRRRDNLVKKIKEKLSKEKM